MSLNLSLNSLCFLSHSSVGVQHILRYFLNSAHAKGYQRITWKMISKAFVSTTRPSCHVLVHKNVYSWNDLINEWLTASSSLEELNRTHCTRRQGHKHHKHHIIVIKNKIHSSCEIKDFCRNSSLQAVCDTPIARITGCVSSLLYRSATPLASRV